MIIIDPAALLALKTRLEVRILALLGAPDDPLQKKDIVESLKTNGKCCAAALKSLIENGLVSEIVNFRVTLYEAATKVKTLPCEVKTFL